MRDGHPKVERETCMKIDLARSDLVHDADSARLITKKAPHYPLDGGVGPTAYSKKLGS
jgi:hypothetical protein